MSCLDSPKDEPTPDEREVMKKMDERIIHENFKRYHEWTVKCPYCGTKIIVRGGSGEFFEAQTCGHYRRFDFGRYGTYAFFERTRR